MTVLAILLWLIEHWFVLAGVAAVALGAALFAGLVSAASVVARLLQAVAAVVGFFLDPRGQIAAKILYGLVAVSLGLSSGYWHGKSVTNAAWEQRAAQAQAAFERKLNEARAAADAENVRRAEADADEIAKLKEAFHALESRTRDGACLERRDNDGLRKLWSPRRR
jgi:hypothetical protein